MRSIIASSIVPWSAGLKSYEPLVCMLSALMMAPSQWHKSSEWNIISDED
jgi:hypothetical protein